MSPRTLHRRSSGHARNWFLSLLAVAAAFIHCSSAGGGDQIAGGNTSEVGNGKVMGRLFVPQGTPASGATVRAVPADFAPPPGDTANPDFHEVVADSDGVYVIDSLDPGFYTIEGQLGSLGRIMTDADEVVVDDTVVIPDDTLVGTGAVTGVTYMVNAPAAAQRRLWAYIDGTSFRGYPDTTGVFVVDGIPEGNYVLTVEPWLGGYFRYTYDIAIIADSTLDLDTLRVDLVP